jgi:hypothetical protein
MIEKTDVLHPVDSYNLIKRTARMWQNITSIQDLVEARSVSLSSITIMLHVLISTPPLFEIRGNSFLY